MKKGKSFFKQIRAQVKQKRNAPQYHELKLLLEAFDQQNERAADILYFGDSVIQRISKYDEDIQTLGEMVAKRFEPIYKTCVIAHSAYTPKIFLSLSRVLKITHKRPKLIILPVNLRSLSPQWDHYPSWQFKREILAIRKFYKNQLRKVPRLIPSDQLPLSHRKISKFMNRKVNYPFTKFNQINQFIELIKSKPNEPLEIRQRWRIIFIYHYLNILRHNHHQLRSLKKLIELLFKMNVFTVIYLTPINYQAGVRLIGEEFTRIVSKNIAVIKQVITKDHENQSSNIVLKKPGLLFVDWSMTLSDSFFFHENEATEHLNESGRIKLANTILDLVRSIPSFDCH